MSIAEAKQEYRIEPTDYAIVIHGDGEVSVYIPASEPAGHTVPKQALALLVIANKLCDDAWVNALLEEDYFEDAVLMAPPDSD